MLGLCWCKCLHVYVWLLCHLTYLHMYCKFRIIASTTHTISSVPHDDVSIDYWIVYKSISINFSTRLHSDRSHGLKWFNMEISNYAQEGTRTVDSDTISALKTLVNCKSRHCLLPRVQLLTLRKGKGQGLWRIEVTQSVVSCHCSVWKRCARYSRACVCRAVFSLASSLIANEVEYSATPTVSNDAKNQSSTDSLVSKS